jgi:hypothetical protein
MARVRNPDFGTNPLSYEASVGEWEQLWNSMDRFARDLDGWTAPWLDTSMRDGNPIFSAWSPTLRRAIRIIQHGEADTFAVWRNTFAKGSAGAVDELVINCALTDDHVDRARELVAAWLEHRSEVARARPRPSLDVELPHSHLAA